MLNIVCPSFGEDGEIPKKHTGFGEDFSPQFVLSDMNPSAKSLAIIMDDLDVPFRGELNHWIIWNLPPVNNIEENIPYGAECPNGAKQGVAYGKNRYRGPKQPPFIKKAHRYRYTFYVLDCMLNLPTTSRKVQLIEAMGGHILQSAEIVGWYRP